MIGHKATNPVRTTQTTLRIIEGIESLEGATLTELSSHLDEPKSTIHNHLSTLLEKEYIVKEGKEYYFGLRFTELGEQSKIRYDLYNLGISEVEALAEETGELCNIAVEEHGQVVYLHRVSGEYAISTDTFSGKRVSSHCTALGKVMLAHMSSEKVESIMDHHGLPAVTEHTITDRDELYNEFEQIRTDGIAFDDEERAYGIRCVAAPILDHDTEEVIGAVSISAPVNRMQSPRIDEKLPELVHQTTNIIEIELAYGG